MNIIILVIYDYLRDCQKLILNFVYFFKNEVDVIDFIKLNNYELNRSKFSNKNNIINNLINLIKDYIAGKKISLFEKVRALNIDLNLEEIFPSDFALSVIKYLIENIKYGKTTTYSEIGKVIGSRAYRAIGNILRKNPLPLIIPCHRVIRKNGKTGGFMGYSNNSDNWQQQLKRDLLEIESYKD